MNKFLLFDHFPDCRHPGFDWERHNRLFKSKNVIFWAKSRQVEFPEHWGCLSVKTVFAGVENFVIDNEPFALTTNKYLILNDGQHYGSYIDSEEEVESFTINFTSEFIKEIMPSLQQAPGQLLDAPSPSDSENLEFIQHFHLHDTLITPLIARIRLLVKDFRQNQLELEDAYYYFFKALVQKYHDSNQIINKAPATRKSTKVELTRRLARARDFMDSNFTKAISLEDIAQVACMSQYHLLDCFKAIYALTPYQYLTQVRLEEAKKLLETRDVSVQQVCQSVGYEDISSFSKLYKKTFGISPSKTRRNI